MKETDYEGPTFGDATDIAILMHRETHFGGSFPIMIDYYQRGGKGVCLDFEIPRISELAEEERLAGGNLAALLLTPRDIEEVKKARDSYQIFRDLYAVKSPKSPYPAMIADLILSEEDEPIKEVEAIVAEKSAIVPSLLALINSEDMYNPLFPGYGKAPALAAYCLGKIGDKRAIIALFENLGKDTFFEDEININALKAIGEPAKEFLLRVLQGHPINEDNEKAAIALVSFGPHPEIAKTCLDMLLKLDLKKDPFLATYLILTAEHLSEDLKPSFEAFASRPDLPKDLKNDCATVLNAWGIKK
jgi:hypothetical protein